MLHLSDWGRRQIGQFDLVLRACPAAPAVEEENRLDSSQPERVGSLSVDRGFPAGALGGQGCQLKVFVEIAALRG